jgi:cytoskeletal protein CcmA (bactofilin family)
MLKKNRTFEDDKELGNGTTTDQGRFSMSPGPEADDEKTTIGEHIFIDGNIRGEEHLFLEGSIKGNIEMGKHNFVVGAKGRFEGEISAQNVGISGQLQGTVNVRNKVKITKEADFIGDIKAQGISVEEGAYFKGSIELDRDPHRKATQTGKPSDKAVSAPGKPSAAQPDKADKEKELPGGSANAESKAQFKPSGAGATGKPTG